MAGQENPSPNYSVVSRLDDASLAVVADLVRFHLSFRELIRLQLVSKEWRTWCSHNAWWLWKARKQDATGDWYFPTAMRPHPGRLRWYGLHHPSEMEHRLPDLDFLSDCKAKILAGASGLLLVHTQNSRAEKDTASKLVVCNPLTKKWRHLPQLDEDTDPTLQGMGSTLDVDDGEQDMDVHVVVNDISNTYQVVMIMGLSVCTYDSQTNEWSSIDLPSRLPATTLSIGSVCYNNRIYLLWAGGAKHQDVVVIAYHVGSRRWMSQEVCTLYEECGYGGMFGEGRPRGPTLVACLGDVYAMVPVIENRKTTRVRTEGLFKTGTMRFEVFKLQLLEEEQEVNYKFEFCAALPLQVKIHMRYARWLNFALNPWSWYRCTAQGAVIWLACEDHLLQFDVVNRCCNTNTVQLGAICRGNSRPYEPSFHANP